MKRRRTKKVLGLNVFNGSLDKVSFQSKTCRAILTISPNSYGMATRDRLFHQALKDADFLVLDGVYFALASIIKGQGGIKPNNGPTTFSHFMARLNQTGGKVFFLGSLPSTLDKIKSRAAIDYPNLQVGVYSPPYKTKFTSEENAAMVDVINAFKPDIVFVGMTAPKQEKWAHQHKDRLNSSLIIAIGAVFDWYAGNERPIAPIWWKLHLGWLIRTMHRPEILKRYPNIALFFWHLLLDVTRIRSVQ